MPLPDRVHHHLGSLIEGCWLAVVGLVPLFFISLVARPFYPPKAMLLQFLAIVMLAAVVSRWLLEGRGVSAERLKAFLRRRVIIAALAFAAVAVIATVLSLSPWTSLAGSVNRRQGLLTILSWLVFFFVLATSLRTRPQLLRLVVVLLVSSGVMSIIGILEHYVPSFPQWFLSTTYTNRSAATTGNALSLSAYLGMAMPFTLAAAALAWRLRAQLTRPIFRLAALGLLLALQAWCLVLSIYSFTLLLYLVPSGLFLALFALLVLRRRAVTLVALGLLVVVIAGGALIVLPQWQNAVEGTDPYERGTPLPADTPERLTGTLYGRARYWVYALEVLPQAMSNPQPGDAVPWLRPLIGYGPETYVIVTQRHFPPEYLSAQTNGAQFRDRAHNSYIDLAVTTGFLGLAAWLALITGCGVLLYRLVRREDAWSPLALTGLAAGCAVAGFLAHGIFNPIAFAEEALLWTCLGFAVAMASPTFVRDRATAAPQTPVSTGPAATARAGVACLLVLCAAIVGVLLTLGPLLADAAQRKGTDMSVAEDSSAVYQYARATELQPRQSTYWGLLADYTYKAALLSPGVEAKASILELSLMAMERARDNEPLFFFWHHRLGSLQLYAASVSDLATVQDALASYERAAELSPRNALIADRIAVAHMVLGDWEAAALALRDAAEYDPSWNQTNHLKVACAALSGEGAVATQALLYLIDASPHELVTFAQVITSRLQPQGMAVPVAVAMLPYLEAGGDGYAPLAARGVLFALSGDPAQAASLLTAAMQAAQPDEAAAVETVTQYLASFVPGLGEALTA